MSAHTPGPWVVVDRKHWSASIALVTTGKPTPVAWASRLIRSGDDEALANARLIAAAPELLEALRSAYQFHRVVECISEPTQGGEECSCQAFDPVRAAIAKATGGTP